MESRFTNCGVGRLISILRLIIFYILYFIYYILYFIFYIIFYILWHHKLLVFLALFAYSTHAE